MKLNAVQNDQKGRVMCGTAAISAVTGNPVSCVKEFIYRVKGRRYVCSMSVKQVVDTLRLMGYSADVKAINVLKGNALKAPTFARWLRERENVNEVYVLLLTDHFVAVNGRKMVDNHTMEPVFIGKAPWRRKRVRWTIRIQKGGD